MHDPFDANPDKIPSKPAGPEEAGDGRARIRASSQPFLTCAPRPYLLFHPVWMARRAKASGEAASAWREAVSSQTLRKLWKTRAVR